MKQKLLHTPEGVRDIYNGECETKLFLEEKLQNALLHYGYHPIQTPTFEFFDIFGKDVGTTHARDLYKFFDREGNTLVLRPDITPSIARAAAKFFMDETMPVRFCYKGNTFINTNSLQGRLKENTQLGAELVGDNSADADAEMLAMIVECLKLSGLTDFQISVGHAGIFAGLMDAAGLDEEEEDQLADLLLNNNFFGVQEFLDARPIDPNIKELFGLSGRICQSAQDFSDAKKIAQAYPKVYDAICCLEQQKSLALLYGIDKYIGFELGMVSSFKYYTGIIFRGYTFGSGEPIVKGGRYDSLLQRFGKHAPAIGFAIVVDQLLAALSRQRIEMPLEPKGELIVYDDAHRKDAILCAEKKRASGQCVELIFHSGEKSREDYEAYAARNRIASVTFMQENKS